MCEGVTVLTLAALAPTPLKAHMSALQEAVFLVLRHWGVSVCVFGASCLASLDGGRKPCGGSSCIQVEMLYPYLCTHTPTRSDKYAPGSVTLGTHTSVSPTSEYNKWGKHQECVTAARKHGSVLLPTGWCLSLSLILTDSFTRTHTQTHTRESVKIPIIRLAFPPSMLGAVIKIGAKFEVVGQSDGM